jgi:hypothetical protein
MKHEVLHRHLHQLRRRNRLSHDVFARFSPHFSPEIRGAALRRLAAQTRFGFEGGTQLMMYTQYLRDIDREHVAYTKKDLSDLLELCDYFLRNPLERQRLAANAQSFFDRYLHRDQLAAYHLHSILARV